MSISIIAPKPLLRLCKCLETKLDRPNAVSTPHHVSCQEKPRVVFTFIPPSSENLMDELVATLGPLDVVVDCFSDRPEAVAKRSKICADNCTQYLSLAISADMVVAEGSRTAFEENKNLLRKINKGILYTGDIYDVRPPLQTPRRAATGGTADPPC